MFVFKCYYRSYMYLSSDSLRTRMSLIRSILHSSPSMSSTVIVESAIEIASSAEKKDKNKALLLGSYETFLTAIVKSDESSKI